jgi:hypothetical protein
MTVINSQLLAFAPVAVAYIIEAENFLAAANSFTVCPEFLNSRESLMFRRIS